MNHTPSIKFLRLRPEPDADLPLPRYMTPRAAGMDIYAAIEKDLLLEAGAIALIPTGFALALPEGFEAQIRPRSGLATKHGIGIINSPGTIDADYRGEIKIALINLGEKNDLNASRLIGLVNEQTRTRNIEIGKIAVCMDGPIRIIRKRSRRKDTTGINGSGVDSSVHTARK